MRLADYWHQGLLKVFPHLSHRLDLANAYQTTFSTPLGRKVLFDLFREAGLLECALAPGDPHMTAFNVGKRAVAEHLLHRLRWAEGEILQLAQETTYEELLMRENAARAGHDEELLPQ